MSNNLSLTINVILTKFKGLDSKVIEGLLASLSEPKEEVLSC